MVEEKHYCKCGCGKEIIIKPHHKYYGIPEYINTHNLIIVHKNIKGLKRTPEQINTLKDAFKNRKYKNKICKTCGINFEVNNSRQNWCTDCSKQRRKEYQRVRGKINIMKMWISQEENIQKKIKEYEKN